MKKEILEMLNDFSKEEIEDFLGGVENETLFYFVRNYETGFERHKTFQKYMNAPFLIACNFFDLLESLCYYYIGEENFSLSSYNDFESYNG